MNEYDMVVTLVAKMSDYDQVEIPIGSVGTIVMIYNDGEAYEVEFASCEHLLLTTYMANEVDAA